MTLENINIDPKKVDAIRKMEASQCKREFESFQVMMNYLQHYSSQLTQLVELPK